MDGFLTSNWFSIILVAIMIGNSIYQRGISKQRGAQTEDAIGELKTVLKEKVDHLEKNLTHEVETLTIGMTANSNAIQAHVTNSDAHVTSVFLELLKTRHDFVSQQLSDARQDVQRIEQMLARTKGEI